MAFLVSGKDISSLKLTRSTFIELSLGRRQAHLLGSSWAGEKRAHDRQVGHVMQQVCCRGAAARRRHAVWRCGRNQDLSCGTGHIDCGRHAGSGLVLFWHLQSTVGISINACPEYTPSCYLDGLRLSVDGLPPFHVLPILHPRPRRGQVGTTGMLYQVQAQH